MTDAHQDDDGLGDARGAIDRAAVGEPEMGGEGPEGCPVIPLGTRDGHYFYLTPLKQIACYRFRDHSPLGIISLFEGEVAWLWSTFPIRRPAGDDGEEKVTGWHAQRAATWLMRNAKIAGIVDLSTQLRGLGAWPDDMEPSRLVFHAGDKVVMDGQELPPGRHGRYIYAASRPIDAPGASPLTPDQAKRLLMLLETWNWRYEEIMSRLLLGWLAVAGVPGALAWRPSIWLSGDAQTGKSTLMELLHRLMGSTAYHLANISEPGIRQALKCDAISVMVDEFEGTDLQEVVGQVLNLVRIASSSSSGESVRGSSDGVAAFTRLTTCFAFASIVVPPLSTANQDRLTLFDMRPLDEGKADDADPEEAHRQREVFLHEFQAVARFGPALRRRVIDQWHRFRLCLDAYGAALARAGHKNRAADQLGTMLAGAELLLGDGIPTRQQADELAALLPAERLAEDVDDMPTHTRWLLDLITQPAGNWHSGQRAPIGKLITNCIPPRWDETSAAELRALGLRVVPQAEAEERWKIKDTALLIANRHMQLKRMLEGTEWAGVDWKLVLRRAPDARAAGVVSFGQEVITRATVIPMSQVPIVFDKAKASQAKAPDQEAPDF